jgi:hypothetical protein
MRGLPRGLRGLGHHGHAQEGRHLPDRHAQVRQVRGLPDRVQARGDRGGVRMNSARDIGCQDSAPVEEGYRSQEIRDLCSHCKEFAVSKCARCGRPLCVGHQHDEDKRCMACEDDYRETLEAASIRRGKIERWFSRPYRLYLIGSFLGPMFGLIIVCSFLEQLSVPKNAIAGVGLIFLLVITVLPITFMIIARRYESTSLAQLNQRNLRYYFFNEKLLCSVPHQPREFMRNELKAK